MDSVADRYSRAAKGVMRLAIKTYLIAFVFFMIFFGILDGWEGVRAYMTAASVVAGVTLIVVGIGWLGKKLGIRIND